MNYLMHAVLGLALCSALVARAQTCELVPATVTKLEKGQAWVYSPDQKTAVVIAGTEIDERGHVWHAGPVEIVRQASNSNCQLPIDLLEQPFMFTRDRYFYFLSGDGLHVALKMIDTAQCRLVWSSKDFSRDNAPVMLPRQSEVHLSQKAVVLGDACVPAIASALPSASQR